MSKRLKTLSGYFNSVSPIKEGKKNHDWAEAKIQTGSGDEEKVLFFFSKPAKSSAVYQSALKAYQQQSSVSISGLSEDSDDTHDIHMLVAYKELLMESIGQTDEKAISTFLLGSEGPFRITFNARSKNVETLQRTE